MGRSNLKHRLNGDDDVIFDSGNDGERRMMGGTNQVLSPLIPEVVGFSS